MADEKPVTQADGDGDELTPGSDPVSDLLLELARSPERDPAAIGAALSPGDVVGRFELVREIGRGGFGVVFEARDRELGRLVAFKAMRPLRGSGKTIEQPLREEAEAAARLNHPNIVTLHDYGIHEGTPYLILELLRGQTLQERLKRGPLSPLAAVRLAMDVAGGLVHAHAAGVIHRDLKPANVFLCVGAGPKLLDFGLARLRGRASPGAAGTPAYMAPEQLRGAGEDARTDVFAAAVVLFQMLSGELPFAATRGRSAVLDPGPPPRLPIPDAPPELVALLSSALSKDPAGRPQSAQALLDGLAGVERAYERLAEERARTVRRRRLRRAAFAAGAAACLVASGIAALAIRARSDAEAALRQSRLAGAAESASDPLLAALLMSELGDDPPPRAVEIAQRVLRQPIPIAVLEGAPAGAWALAVSPDGRRVAAGLREGVVAVWDLEGAGPPMLQRTGGRRVNVVAFTPDGTRIVAAAHDGEVKVLRADASAPAERQATADSPIARLRVSPDGRWAAAGSLDGRAWLIDLTRRRPPRAILHDGAVYDVAFSTDGTRLVTASVDGAARVLDPRTGELLAKIRVPGGAVFAATFSPDARVIATASEDGIARLWRADGTGAFVALPAAAPPLSGVAFSPDGARLVVAGGDGTAHVHRLDAASQPVRLRGHREALFSAEFSPDGARVITSSIDGTVRVWHADGEGEPLVLRGHGAFNAAFTPDGRRMLTRGKDGAIRVYDAADPRERGILRGHEGLVDTVEWTRGGTQIVTAGHDGTARIWAISGAGTPVVFEDPSGILHSADLDPGETRLVTGAEDGVVRLWNASDGALLAELRGHEGPVLSAVFSPDGRRIASASLDRTVRIWRADGSGEPEVLEGHEGGLTSVTWSPDGRWIISASSLDATVRVWPSEGGAPRVLRAEHGVFRASASPDGHLVLAEEDGGVRLFRLDTLEELPPLPIRPEALWAAMFSPDGERLALTSMDGTVRVVRVDGGGEPLVLRGHEAPVGHAAFSPDGRLLATAGADGTVRIWTVDWGALRAELRETTTACLPVAHRIQVLGEKAEDARRRNEACHHAHGRSTVATPPASGQDPAARAGDDAAIQEG
jgi:eukaryotic-like serine/threonine-protein kinase